MGVIGCGWTAHFLGQGYAVRVWDPVEGVKERLNSFLDLAWPAMTDLGLSEGADRNNFVVCETVAEAVQGALLVQESAPERLDLKVELLSELDKSCSSEVVIASSTSGYLVSDMIVNCEDAPERVVVGHPFNPVYLLPLVEVVGGPKTSKEILEKAQNIYESTGKIVLKLDKEVDGFISDRLQEAMWREALHMVANGEATVEQLDLAITAGPGLRWALMGPMLTFHLAGGEGGMAHMLDHFGPSLKSPWTRLEAPELTRELRDAVVGGCEDEADGRSVAALVNERDKGLIAIIKALRAVGVGTPGDGGLHGA
jgi:carnitine 3-dehydrogenase